MCVCVFCIKSCILCWSGIVVFNACSDSTKVIFIQKIAVDFEQSWLLLRCHFEPQLELIDRHWIDSYPVLAYRQGSRDTGLDEQTDLFYNSERFAI